MSDHAKDCLCAGTGEVLKLERAYKHRDPGEDQWGPARDERGRFTGEKVPCPYKPAPNGGVMYSTYSADRQAP